MNLDQNTKIIIGLGLVAGLGMIALVQRKRGPLFVSKGPAPAAGPLPRQPSGHSTPVAAAGLYRMNQYKPFAPETIDLFTAAVGYAGLPREWASSPGLHNILHKESMDGWVGIPNYQFGKGSSNAERATWLMNNRDFWPIVWAAVKSGVSKWKGLIEQQNPGVWASDKKSSATGLGQLTWSNIASGNYYPSGVNGIGVALEEAIGMIRYIKQRYGDPETAWAKYGKYGEGY